MANRESPLKVSQTTYNLLIKIQAKLPGKPTLISLLKEAIELLAEKYLPTDKSERKQE